MKWNLLWSWIGGAITDSIRLLLHGGLLGGVSGTLSLGRDVTESFSHRLLWAAAHFVLVVVTAIGIGFKVYNESHPFPNIFPEVPDPTPPTKP